MPGPDEALVPRSLSPFTPHPLEPRPPSSLEALLEEAIPLRPPALDPGPTLAIRAFLLGPAPLQPLLNRFAPAPERDYVTLSASETPWVNRPALRARIGDAIVPCETHLAGGSATAEAL
jgi:hypothetical protein